MSVRLTANMSLSYAPEFDYPMQVVSHGTTTADGAAGGTTIVDTTGPGLSGAAHTYAGRYWVKILSGAYIGLSKRITADGGAGTLTLENNGFPGQIVSGVEYQILLSSEPVVVVDSSGSATDVVDAVRDEANDTWIGYTMEPLTGDRAGEAKAVTDSVSGTGTFVTAAFSGALAAGDVCLLRRHIEPVGVPSFSPSQPLIAKPQKRANFSKGQGFPGARAATIAFDLHLKGSGSLAAAASIANAAEIVGLMQACGYSEDIGTSMVVGTGSTTGAIKIATATHERVSIGQAVMYAGNVTFITAKTDGGGGEDTLTVAPALPTAPVAAATLYACRTYSPDTTASQKPCTIYYERDGVRYTLFGCTGNLEIVPGDNTECLAKFSFVAEHYIVENEEVQAIDNLSARYSTARPLLGSDRICYLDATRADIGGVSATSGHTSVLKKVSGAYGINGSSGSQTTDYAPMVRFRQIMDESSDALTAESLYQAQTAKIVSLVYGSHGNCVAIRLPVARVVELPAPTDSEGMLSHNYAFEAQDAGSVSDPTDGTVDLPDFSIHIF